MASMSCPKCGGRMYEAEESGVRLDRCSGCEGLWFDHHMLRAWFEKRMSAHDTGDVGEFMSPALSEPSDLTCPLCRSKLLSTTNAGITVEWCDTCHGIFLDADEPDKIMAWRRKLRGRNRKETAKAALQTAAEFMGEVFFGGPFGK